MSDSPSSASRCDASNDATPVRVDVDVDDVDVEDVDDVDDVDVDDVDVDDTEDESTRRNARNSATRTVLSRCIIFYRHKLIKTKKSNWRSPLARVFRHFFIADNDRNTERQQLRHNASCGVK